MSSDKRFDKVFSDPRFMVAPKKVSKVKIDKRFEGMFKEKSFNVIAKVDKYGRRIDKKDTRRSRPLPEQNGQHSVLIQDDKCRPSMGEGSGVTVVDAP